MFEKEHYNVIRDIKALDCGTEFNALNFEAISYIDSMNREKPEYLMTRLGFSVLTMNTTELGIEAAPYDAIKTSLSLFPMTMWRKVIDKDNALKRR